MNTFSNIRGDDIIDVRDIIERIEELQAQQTPRFVAGFNMAGYMPDSEPAEFDDADDAKRYIIESIKHAEDAAETEELAEQLAAFAEEVNLEGDEFSGQGPDGLVYWVTEDGVMGLDEEEAEELAALLAVMEELQGQGGDEQWEGNWYPLTLIADHHFTEAMRELVSDIGDLPAEVPSYIEIDWDATANNLRVDYTSIEVDGTTYWFR